MFPLPAIPTLWKLGALALLLATVAASSYVAGRKAVRAQMEALQQSYAVAAAQAAGREAERGRVWKSAVTTAGVKYEEARKVADTGHSTSLERLRNAYTGRDRVRPASAAPADCPGPSGPTAGELLQQGEILAGIIRDADQDRAGLMACVGAWPR